MDVQLPNGKILRGVPDGTTKEQLSAKLKANGLSVDSPNWLEREGKAVAQGVGRGAAERMLGVGELANNLGVGKTLGLPSNEILESAKGIAEEQGKGTGVAGAVGEFIGDPLTLAGGGEVKAAHGVYDLAKAGAKYGAAAGATETGAKDIKENVQNAAEGAGIGAVAPYALKGAGKVIGKVGSEIGQAGKLFGEGFSARSKEALDAATRKFDDIADENYAQMRTNGVKITPEKSVKIVDSIENQMKKDGKLTPLLHKKAINLVNTMRSEAANGLSVEDLDIYDRAFAELYTTSARAGKGNQAFKARQAMDAIDDAYSELGASDLPPEAKNQLDSLTKAKATWSKKKSFQKLADIAEKSEGDPNKIKSELEKLVNNDRLSRGFTKEEKEAIREAAKNTTIEGLTKMAGKLGITLGDSRAAATGNALPAVELLYGGMKKGMAGVAVGTGAKYAQKKMAQAKLERLLKMIEGRGETLGPEATEALGATADPLAGIENQQKMIK